MKRMQHGKVRVRRALYGWVAFLPLIAGLFAMLAMNTQINVQSRHADYQFSQLRTERRMLVQTLDELNSEEARMNGMQALDGLAVLLGLQPPAPGQIQVVIPRSDLPLPLLMDTPERRPVAAPPAPGPSAVSITTAAVASWSPAVQQAASPNPPKLAAVPSKAAAPIPVAAQQVVIERPPAPSKGQENLDVSTAAMMAAL